MNQRACMDCEFWESDNPEFATTEMPGKCKINPPTVYLMGRASVGTAFPKTIGGDWCGKFQPKEA